ncbi:hypothetical protein JIO05_02510 [Pediococcus acidilactici]|jgi:hypothetical protein|uniref:capsular polysaccharide synthesis protein n=1 Tax=Pediococcus acidilactici TaxID=1254 RepID=UPI001911484D|nr:capsular polysaccharide synthesis protein [Pediococcus acidilactici]QQP83824.1 hypothetical protein JIO05_02510 [Pediococcus acidilactici]
MTTLVRKGYFFLLEQGKKIRIFPVKLILLQIIAKFIPFFKFFPKIIVEKICLASQKEIIKFIDENISVGLKESDFSKVENYKVPRIIWVMWLQGIDEAPELVKKCINSTKKFGTANNFKVNIITQENIENYIKVPQRIKKLFYRRNINGANYSDYCRCALLAKYGGIWIDATVFVNNTTSFDIASVLNMPFFSVRNEDAKSYITNIARHRWNTCVLAAPANSLLFTYSKSFLEEYYRKYDQAIDYLLIDYSMHMACVKYSSVKKAIDSLPMNNRGLLWLDQHANEKYNNDYWKYNAVDTLFFKLNRKNKYKLLKSTMLGEIIGGI